VSLSDAAFDAAAPAAVSTRDSRPPPNSARPPPLSQLRRFVFMEDLLQEPAGYFGATVAFKRC
jgi:hypothetical protein